jgi:hypothetical protein
MKSGDLSIYCEILSIHTSCFTLKDVKKAYRQCVLKYHPDTNPNNEILNKKFAQIVKAYKYLQKYCQSGFNEINSNPVQKPVPVSTKRIHNNYFEKKSYTNKRNDNPTYKKRITINDLNFRTNKVIDKTTNQPVKEQPAQKKKISMNDINYSKYMYKNRLLDYRRKYMETLKTNLDTKRLKCKLIINSTKYEMKLSDLIFRLNYSTNDNVKLYCIRELEKSDTKLAMWALIKVLNSDSLSFYLKKESVRIIKNKSNRFIKKFILDCKTKINNFIKTPRLVSYRQKYSEYLEI